MRVLVLILLIGSVAVVIWWPMTLAIVDKPVSVLWLVPLGFLVTGICFGLAEFVFDLVIGMPLSMLVGWLMKDTR